MYDVIVVGAGPAGSSAAYHCAKKGFKTLLLEKRKQIGIPKQCGEGINQQILEELNLKLKPEWISKKIDSLVVFNFHHFIKFKGKRSSGFVLDRKKFDPGLAQKAREAGAELRLNSPVTDITKEGVICNNKEIKGKIILGADGPNTLIGEKSGLGKPKCGFGLQYEIETANTSFPDSLQFCFEKNLKNKSYFWVFPKKETLNIGIVDLAVRNLKPDLDLFIKKLGLEKERIKETNAGLIPLYGPLDKFCNERILLLGDAAGHTNPLSGGGIPVAIFDGILASEIISKHFKENAPLTNYQNEWWQSGFGKSTLASFKIRKLFIQLLEKDKIDFLLNRLGNQEIKTKKELFKLILKIPLVDLFKIIWGSKSFIKYFRYAW